MANVFLKFLKEPDPKEPIKDNQLIDKKYRHYQWRIFYSLYIGYVVSYIGRQNLPTALKSLEKVLNVSNTQLGLLGSSFFFTYAIGKFVNGILADKANVRTFFSTALVLCAICLICFGLAISFNFISITALLWILAFFWGANGWFQSMTFPPISKSLSYWFTGEKRGLRWSLVSTSHQVGVFFGTAIAIYGINHFGVQSAFYLPGIISLLTGLFLFNRLRDKPTTLGLPEVEKYEEQILNNREKEVDIKNMEEKKEDEDSKLTYVEMLKKHILSNPMVWILVIAFLFVYVVKTASEVWLTKYFIEVRGDVLAIAGSKTASLSIVGVFGTILSGIASDKLFKGRRTPVTLAFLVGLAISLFIFAGVPNEYAFLDFLLSPLIGMFVAGLQNLIGLTVVEMCAKGVASAANGFAGTFSYIGAIFSTTVTGWFIDKFGWNSAIYFWIFSTVTAILLILVVLPREKVKNF